MSTPAIVTVCVIGMCVLLPVLLVLGMCLASSDADDALGIGEGFPAGTGAAADAAPESVAGDESSPSSPARNLHPSSGVSSADLALDEDTVFFRKLLAEMRAEDGPEGGVE